jgi:hypothetical protein
MKDPALLDPAKHLSLSLSLSLPFCGCLFSTHCLQSISPCLANALLHRAYAMAHGRILYHCCPSIYFFLLHYYFYIISNPSFYFFLSLVSLLFSLILPN